MQELTTVGKHWTEYLSVWELDRQLTQLEFELNNSQEPIPMGEVSRRVLLSRKGQIRAEFARRNTMLV